MAYAYQIGGPREVADAIWEAVRWRYASGNLDPYEMRNVLFEQFLLWSLIDVADSGDSQTCSRALQLLKKEGKMRYSRRRRVWELNESEVSRGLQKEGESRGS